MNEQKAFRDSTSESRMLKSLQETINFLACIAYKHEEISRGRFIELTGEAPENFLIFED